MAYMLESEDHVSIVKETFEQWSRSTHDMFFISSDGHKIFTQKIILSFYSPMIATILDSLKEEVGICVNAPSNLIVNMMKVLTTGLVMGRTSVELEQISQLAQSLGINFKNWQVGSRKKRQPVKVISSKKKSMSKAAVTNVLTSNNNIDKKSLPYDADPKLHYCEDCGKSFAKKDKLTRHQLIHSGTRFICNVCSSKFARKDKLSKHIKEKHGELDFNEVYKNTATISTIIKEETEDGFTISLNETKDGNETTDDIETKDDIETHNNEIEANEATEDSKNVGRNEAVEDAEESDSVELDENIDSLAA